jgi:ligand-binding SRPBCC domain-containing protein
MDRAWAFFSDPRNLARITPPEMAFRIRTDLRPNEFYEGMRIEYLVRPIPPLRMRWVSEIREVDAPHHFTDVQVRGPYAHWVHRHAFSPVENGVRMDDRVLYRMPFGWLGRVLHTFVIRKKLEDIFEYRSKQIQVLFQ